jgi:UPF0716 family protein affecting phage T7 exclusion
MATSVVPAGDVDWKKAPGRMSGLLLSVAGILLATPVPILGFITGVLGFGLSLRVFRAIPRGNAARRLTIAGIIWGAGAVLWVVGTDIVTFLAV